VPTSSLFLAPSFLNHSCSPNAHRSFFREDSSVVFIKATRDIAENEQVTISYIDLLEPLDNRQVSLKQRWGFDCVCERCKYELAIPIQQTHLDLITLSQVESLLTPQPELEEQIITEQALIDEMERQKTPPFILSKNYRSLVSQIDAITGP